MASQLTKLETKKSRAGGPVSETANPSLDQSNTNPVLDLSKIVEDSKINLSQEKPKRTRRTKEELEKVRLGLQPQNSIMPVVDRSKELKPMFLMYSELFFAKPLGIDELKLSDAEAESLSMVTSNLMNAFPQYFNSTDPKMAAILGAAFVALPIGYTKYKIYSTHQKTKKQKTKVVETKPEVPNLSENTFGVSPL